MAAAPANHRVWGGGAIDPPCFTAVERHAVPRAPLSPMEYQLNTPPGSLAMDRRAVRDCPCLLHSKTEGLFPTGPVRSIACDVMRRLIIFRSKQH